MVSGKRARLPMPVGVQSIGKRFEYIDMSNISHGRSHTLIALLGPSNRQSDMMNHCFE